MNLQEYVGLIEKSNFLDCLDDLYIDFPFRCYEVTNLLFKMIEDNVGIKAGHTNVKPIYGHFKFNNHFMPHSWIDCGNFIIDPTVIQFISPKLESFQKCHNFKSYFKNNNGVTKTIMQDVGSIIIYKNTELYKQYNCCMIEEMTNRYNGL